MKFCLLSIVGLLVGISSISLKAQNSEKGFFMLQMGQTGKAKEIFNACLVSNPNDAKAHYGLGEYYFGAQKYDSAQKCYDNGIIANPTFAYNYIGLGKIVLLSGNLADAEKKLSQARKLGKKDANISAAIARAYISGPNSYFDLCNKELITTRKLNSKLSEIFLIEGLAFIKNKNYGEAASKFDQALLFDTLKVEAYLNIASIYSFTASKQEAVNSLNLLITRVPDCYVAYRELGNVYYDLGRYNEAKIAYESYHAVTEFSVEERERYAYILFFTKNYDLALEEVKELSHNDPENYIFLRLISYMNFETGKFDKGLESFAKFFEKIPESKIILMDYEYYAKTLASSKQDSLAVINYLKAFEKDTTKLQYLDEAGKISTGLKKYSDAIGYYSKSLNKKQNPIPLDYYQLGRSYYLLANSLVNTSDSVNFDSVTFVNAARQADTLFTKVSLLQPNSYLGFIWRARTNSLLDPESALGLAKPFYEQTLTALLVNPSKYPKEITEVYSYLGYYYYVNNNKEESKANWTKILEIDPANEKAKAAIKDLDTVIKKQ